MIGINELRTLLRQSKRGKKGAFERLLKENAKLAKKVNRKLLNLERAGRAQYSYDAIRFFIENEYDTLGKPRLPTGKKHFINDVDKLYRQLMEARKFDRAQTSTIRGQKKYEKNVMNSFEDILDRKVDKKKLFEVLQDGYLTDLKKYLPSDTILDMVDRAVNAGRSVQEIRDTLDEYLSGKIEFNDIYSNLDIEFGIFIRKTMKEKRKNANRKKNIRRK